MKKILALLLACLLLLPLFGCKDEGGQTPQDGDKDPTAAENVLSTEHYSMTLAMIDYFYHSYYQSMVEYYGSYLSYLYGIDSTKSLKEQQVQQGMSWFQYMLDYIILPNAQSVLWLNEAADEADFMLTDAQLADLHTEAAAADLSAFPNLDAAAYEKYLTLTRRADLYKAQVEGSFVYTDEDYNTYAEENPTEVKVATYLYYAFPYTGLDDAAKIALQAKVRALESQTSEKSFETALATLILEQDNTLTADTAATKLESSVITSETYKDDSLQAWAFAATAEVGDILYYDNTENTSFAIAYLKELPTLDSARTINVRHILAMTTSYDDAVAAHTAADAILSEWLAGDADEASFAALAVAKSEDGGSRTNGGLYENVKAGEMVETFNDWCFDSARKTGDYGLVDTTYGTHVMYFVGEGLQIWQKTANNALHKADYSAYIDGLKEKYGSMQNDELLQNIDI